MTFPNVQRRESKGNAQKERKKKSSTLFCSPRRRGQNVPFLTFDSRGHSTSHPGTAATSPCPPANPHPTVRGGGVGGGGERERGKAAVLGSYLGWQWSVGPGQRATQPRRRNLKLTEGSVQTVTATRSPGGEGGETSEAVHTVTLPSWLIPLPVVSTH